MKLIEIPAGALPVAVPEISCSLLAREISTAATRSAPLFRHRRRSPCSPTALHPDMKLIEIPAGALPVAVPEISCSLLAREISTAATRSAPLFRHWRRSPCSPTALHPDTDGIIHDENGKSNHNLSRKEGDLFVFAGKSAKIGIKRNYLRDNSCGLCYTISVAARIDGCDPGNGQCVFYAARVRPSG